MRGFDFRFDRDFRSLLARLASAGDLDLAGPYLGAEELTALPIRRVLTDVKAWIGSEPHRETAHEWLLSGRTEFRDVPGLHAKIAIGRDAALVGSANFTASGLGAGGNVEAGLLIADMDALAEIRDEYERWWTHGGTKIVNAPELVACWLEAPSQRVPQTRLSFEIPYLERVELEGAGIEPHELGRDGERLLARLRLFPSRAEAEAYLNLEIALLQSLSLSVADPRVVATVPKSSDSLALNINGRWVLRAQFISGGVQYGAMVPVGSSKRYRSQPHFTFALETGAEFIGFSDMNLLRDDRELRESWIEACHDESKSRAGGPLARHRSDAHTNVLLDSDLRRRTLDGWSQEPRTSMDDKAPKAGLVYWRDDEAQDADKQQSFRFYSRQPRVRTELPVGSHLWLATYLRDQESAATLTITAAFEVAGHDEEDGETVVFAERETSRYFTPGGNDATETIARIFGKPAATPALELVQRFRTLRIISPEADATLQELMVTASETRSN